MAEKHVALPLWAERASWCGVGTIVTLVVMGGFNGLEVTKDVEASAASLPFWTAFAGLAALLGSLGVIVGGIIAYRTYQFAQRDKMADRTINLLATYHDRNLNESFGVLHTRQNLKNAAEVNAEVLKDGFEAAFKSGSGMLSGGALKLSSAMNAFNDYFAQAGLQFASKLANEDVFMGNLAYIVLVVYACSAEARLIAQALGNPPMDGIVGLAKRAYPFYIEGPNPDPQLVALTELA